jgi:phenylalanyl-tRNA synthetase beta chain
MELSFNWLSQYVDHGASVAEVAERLTAAGLAVEGMEERGGDYLLDVDVTTNPRSWPRAPRTRSR